MNFKKLKEWSKKARNNIYLLFLAYKDKRTPWYAKIAIICTIGYALSPVDLIPDFIPVLGYLDDLIILPIGISISYKLIPKYVLDEYKKRQEKISEEEKKSFRKNAAAAAALIILFWVAIIFLILRRIIFKK